MRLVLPFAIATAELPVSDVASETLIPRLTTPSEGRVVFVVRVNVTGIVSAVEL